MNIDTVYSLNRSSKSNILDLSNLKINFNIRNDIKNYKYLFLKNNKITNVEFYQNPKIKWIDISNSDVKNVYINLNYLEFLDLSFNRLSEFRVKTHNLKFLNICNCAIKFLPAEICMIETLSILKFSNNQITNIHTLLCKNLQIIEFDNNKITDLTFLQNCKQLERIIANNNYITDISCLTGFNCLQILNIKNNDIDVLPNFFIFMTNLKIFNISNNRIRFIHPDFKNIKYNLYLYNNKLQNIDNDILDIINGKNIYTKLKIYDDGQNVHDAVIQTCLKRNIAILLEYKTIQYDLQTIIQDCDLQSCEDIINKNVLINEKYYKNYLTYFDILNLVYNQVKNNEHKNEICKLLKEEIVRSELEELCFVGKISNIINCLSSFNKDIYFEISENDQIYNILTILKSKYTDIDQIKNCLLKELKERKYSQDIVESWLKNLDYI